MIPGETRQFVQALPGLSGSLLQAGFPQPFSLGCATKQPSEDLVAQSHKLGGPRRPGAWLAEVDPRDGALVEVLAHPKRAALRDEEAGRSSGQMERRPDDRPVLRVDLRQPRALLFL